MTAKPASGLVIVLLSFCLASLSAQPVKTEIKKVGKDFELHRGGKPYFIQGVAGDDRIREIAALGGNSVRISHHALAAQVLDSAQAAGLTVTVVLRIPSKEEGFDPSDAAKSAALIESFNSVILQHKNHPALLLWSAGYEVNRLEAGSAIWTLVNNLAKLCHVLDPNHPVMTILGGVTKEQISAIKKNAPEIDLLGVNTYGALDELPSALRTWGWVKPYIVSDWGPNSDTDVPRTSWEAPIEQHSTQKAVNYRKRYESSIAEDVKLCVGSYAGFWGWKFKTTPTWFGMFLETGEMLGAGDELQNLWTKTPPKNHAPEVTAMKISASTAYDNVILGLESEFSAWVETSDPNGDSLDFKWEILPDTFFYSPPTVKPVPIPNLIVNNFGQRISFQTPDQKGMYRLYVYIYDRRGKAATSNIPFFVN